MTICSCWQQGFTYRMLRLKKGIKKPLKAALDIISTQFRPTKLEGI